MAKRGAAEVVSVDLADMTKLDWQGGPSPADRSAGTGRAAEAFAIVTDALGLDIERRDLSVYDLSPDEVGTFDFVFMGNVLLHLSDPGRALNAVRSVTRGRFLSYEMIQLILSAMLWHLDDARWWTPNLAGHRRLVEAGSFTIERAGRPVLQPFGDRLAAWPRRRADRRGFGIGAQLSYWLFLRRFGVPTSWVLARPTGS
jgi:tRNA (mo5U34)-methyltransferase